MFELKSILIKVGIFSAGAVAGFLVNKKMAEKQYREDVNDIQDFYRNKLKELGVMPEDFDPSEEDEYDEEYEAQLAKDRLIKEAEDTAYYGERRRCVTDYTKPSLDAMKQFLAGSVIVDANGEENLGNIDDDEEDLAEYEPSEDHAYQEELERLADEYVKRRTENMKKGEPYLIEPEEYHEGPPEYERQALYYYAKDRTLCEDDDSKVEDEEECVGFDYEDKLDMQTTCWVRNDKMQMLYEIHRIDESYSKAVLGITETPREREFRLQGRRKQAMDDR